MYTQSTKLLSTMPHNNRLAGEVMSKIKVALIGVGNCASATVQGVYHYRKIEGEEAIGLRRLLLGGYHPRDIEFVSAFDIDAPNAGSVLYDVIRTVKIALYRGLAGPLPRVYLRGERKIASRG